MTYDVDKPWNKDVEGEQVLPLINDDHRVLRISAGPGTGKTFGLRRRVLRILHPEGLACEPSKVLVCAFNRVIAKDLREEIKEELSKYELTPPVIQTIHALCTRIAGAAGTILLPQEEEAMIYDVRAHHPELCKKYGNYAKMRRALDVHQAGLKSYPDLRAAVDQWLADHDATLVGDVPRQVEQGLRQGDHEEHRFQHVLVDEFQDLTEAEARIAVSLVAEGGSLVVLGDRKQSIYHFRGNSRGGLGDIEGLVSTPIVDHTMDECRRCPDEIVRLSNSIMEEYQEPLRETGGLPGQVHNVLFDNPKQEVEGLAREIARVYREAPTRKHLVMVTRRKWGYDLREKIRELDAGVPVNTVFAEDVLETWAAREAFLELSLIAASNTPLAMRDWISYREPDDKGRGFKAPERNADAYKSIRKEFGLLSAQCIDEILLNPRRVAGNGRSIVLKRLTKAREVMESRKTKDDAEELIREILNPERAVGMPQESLALEDLSRLRSEALSLLNELRVRDRDALKDVVVKLRHRIATREPLGEIQLNQPGVKIVTLWGAKGLTSDYVYIMGLVDEALPGLYSQDAEQEPGEFLAEQRRLFYVSLTRGKRSLVLSRFRRIQRGEIPAQHLRMPSGWSSWPRMNVCRFLRDIPPDLIQPAVEASKWAGVDVNQ